MNLVETRQRILEDDDFVLEETKKLQVLFNLKQVLRYHLQREEELETESVADHIYAMHVLADYFLPLEDKQSRWDRQNITTLIQYHDIDEILTGDTISYLKTDAQRAAEASAAEKVAAQIPVFLQQKAMRAITEYENLSTPEARFVKAIDRLEPAFHLYRGSGKNICHFHKVTQVNHSRIKDPYTNSFLYIHRFNKVLEKAMQNEGFFTD